MEIIMRKAKELKPYAANSKKHDDKQIANVANSIRRFGWQQPIVIDEHDVVVIGHCRLLAAVRLGLDEVPVTVASGLTDEEIRELRIADNKTNESPWDEDMLRVDLDGLDFDGFDFDFDIDSDISVSIEGNQIVEDDFDAKPPEQPKSKLGDIYQLGRHRLMVGDSTCLTDVEKLMGGNKADMLLTDPPYNVDYEGKTKNKLKIENDKMKNDKFRQFLVDAFKNADFCMKPGAVFYIWHADSEGYNFRGACVDVGWKTRQCLIWNKNSMVMGRQDYQWKHEPCLYGWKDGASHLWASDRKQTTVIDYQRPTKNDLHPTMKPVGLFDYLIKNNTKPGDVVLDLFGGSGTTIMACEQNGRNCYSMEYDPSYADVIIARWESFTGMKAVRLNV